MNDEITLKFAVDDSVAQGLHITFIIEGFFSVVSTTINFIAHLIFTILSCFNGHALEVPKWLLYAFSLLKK